MSPPIFNPDGSEVSEIVLPDGSTASEVIDPDGNVVFEAEPDIPDSGDLQARFSAKSLSTTTSLATWTDETGNGFDLTANNNPAVVTDSNGDRTVEFDIANQESMDNANMPLSQPYSVFILTKVTSTATNNIIFGSTSGFSQMSYQNDEIVDLFVSQTFDSGLSVALNSVSVYGAVFDGSNSFIRVNGLDATGNPGTSDPSGFRLSCNESLNVFCSQNVREILIYNQDKRAIADDVQNYFQSEHNYTV